MAETSIDLRKEQQASLARPRYKYSLAARFFFVSMDLATGRKTTLAKTVLLEILASIPYRAWEISQYARMTRGYRNLKLVREASGILDWGREAQDKEYRHLLVIQEKMREEGVRDPWYLFPAFTFLVVLKYVLLTRAMALFCIRRAFLFNAEFEDHAEHVYARFVQDHPEWETQAVNSPMVREYAALSTWGDVFRRIGLDERDHRNASFAFCGRPEFIVRYDGMPEAHSAPAFGEIG